MDNFFGIGMPELILILVIAGIVMGPERIGRVARWLGKTTAQLQLISRSFMRQLHNELDGIDDGRALREAMEEVQAMRQELRSLRSEFTTVTTSAAAEGKAAIDEIEHSIRPPTLKPLEARKGGGAELPPSTNGTNKTPPPVAPDLPKLVQVSDDSE
jgi:Sec-independent protein translocase protein TatA